LARRLSKHASTFTIHPVEPNGLYVSYWTRLMFRRFR
jgi:hypothetical protein